MAPTKQLRLAVAMRGGVSLSVWIGGAVNEVDTLRRGVADNDEHNALVGLARTLGYNGVTVDVIAGASAGGLNGVVLAAAMASGKAVAPLRDVWMEAAALEKLVYPVGSGKRYSILNGEYFHRKIAERLTTLAVEPPATAVNPIDLVLAVTSVVPTEVKALTDATVPIAEGRVGAVIRFRHRDEFSDFVPRTGSSRTQAELTAELALAARSTASFPTAFEPMKVEAGQLCGRLEIRPKRPATLRLFDGGVTDNMPVGKAARAIEQAPAEGPTERFLLYMFPSPGAAAERANDNRVPAEHTPPWDLLGAVFAAFSSKSLVDDLSAIDAHNLDVSEQIADRNRLLAPLQPGRVGLIELIRQRYFPPPLPPTADLDAERLVGLLTSPWEHLDAVREPEDLVPKLLDQPPSYIEAVMKVLTERLETWRSARDDLPLLARRSARPWSPVIRSASLLIEWCRNLERGADSPAVGRLKKELYGIREGAYVAACELNRLTLARLPATLPVAEDFAGNVITAREGLVVAELNGVARDWRRIGEIAVAIGALAATATVPDDDLSKVLAAWAGPTADDARGGLDVIDVALLPLHRCAPIGNLTTINYRTVAGTAPSPLSSVFTWPAPLPKGFPMFNTLEPRTSQGEHTVDPATKLAGNQFHNFAAFVDPQWRANDWMWGQLDAAVTLVDTLFAGSDSRPSADQVRDVCTSLGAHGQTLWSTVGPSVAREIDTKNDPLRYTKAVYVWARQMQIVKDEFGRDKDNPGGKAARGKPIEDAMAAWDAAPRRLAAKWGDRKTTASAMRAAFVGWRALFESAPAPLRVASRVLAPLAAPLVGLALGRRRATVALNVFLLGVVVPRVHSSLLGRVAVGAIAVSVTWVWLAKTKVQHESLARKSWGWLSVIALLAVLAELALINGGPLAWLVPTSARGGLLGLYALVPGAAVVVATVVTWFWARWGPRLLIATVNGVITYGSVWLGSHPQPQGCYCLRSLLNNVGSYWWGFLAVMLFTTVVGYNFDVGYRDKAEVA